MNKKYLSIAVAATILSSVAVAIPVFADTGLNANVSVTAKPPMGIMMKGGDGRMGMMKPAVVGTVSAVNGNIITVSGRQGFGTSTPVTNFTVNIANAKILKNNATSTASGIVVGDTVFIQGTVTGTNVTASMVHDGIMNREGMNKDDGKNGQGKIPPQMQGNGQPVVAGSITAISGAMLTITNNSNVVYTVDTTNAKFLQNNGTSTLGNFQIGDSVVVQGVTNGNSITASTVFGQKDPKGNKAESRGFFGGIGQFFKHLFGF